MHSCQDTIREASGDPLTGNELLEQILPYGLFVASGTLLAGVHNMAHHLRNLFTKFVVRIEDVGIENVVVLLSRDLCDATLLSDAVAATDAAVGFLLLWLVLCI